MPSLFEEMNEADLEVRQEAVMKEKLETERRVHLIAEQTKIETQERQNQVLRQQIDRLLEARKKANKSTPVLCEGALGDNEASKELRQVFELLKQEALERERLEEATKLRKKKEAEEKAKMEQEEREREEQRKKELEMQRQKEQDELERQKEKEPEINLGANPSTETMKKVYDWIMKQEAEKKLEEQDRDRLKNLQAQIEKMAKGENRKTCHVTGVNFFTSLDTLQGDGATGVDLAAKAQTAMIAAMAEKRGLDRDDESEGESIHSHISKKHKFTSGMAVKTAHKIKYEVEWAHHWLGKEFQANPLQFNQIKLGHYIMGEAEILSRCTKPEEFQARLRLMRKLGYWQQKFDWPAARNVYAAVMHGIETGR